MKGKLEFELSDPFERDEFELTYKGPKFAAAIFEIRQEVFRPARKHGYADSGIREVVDKIGDDKAEELVWELERLFTEILEKYDLAQHS